MLNADLVEMTRFTHQVIVSDNVLFRFGLLLTRIFSVYLTIILRNRAEYRLILSRRGRRPSRLKSDDIPRD